MCWRLRALRGRDVLSRSVGEGDEVLGTCGRGRWRSPPRRVQSGSEVVAALEAAETPRPGRTDAPASEPRPPRPSSSFARSAAPSSADSIGTPPLPIPALLGTPRTTAQTLLPSHSRSSVSSPAPSTNSHSLLPDFKTAFGVLTRKGNTAE